MSGDPSPAITSDVVDSRTPSALSVRGLRVRVPGAVLLDGVRLELYPGRVHVLLGVSGSGKTTLLRALIGLVPAPGRVEVEQMLLRSATGEQDLARADAARWRQVRGRHIGLVGQDPALALSPLRRVGSMIDEVDRLTHLRADGRNAARDRVLLDAGFPEPGPVRRRYCYELSGGMAQRLGLGLAIAPRPDVLLADEPSTALDPLARAALIDRLLDLAGRGSALMISTHDTALAAQVADDVTVLDQGRVTEAGPAREVLGTATSPAAGTVLVGGGPASVVRTAEGSADQSLVQQTPGDRPAHPDLAGARGPARAPALRLRGLRASYPGTGVVLDGVDLHVADAEVLGVAGRSGAGKSTLLRCIVGLERPDDGDIVVDGHSARDVGWSRLRRQVQLVPQDPRASLNPWRTVEQIVGESLEVHRAGTRPERRTRVAELLDRTDLSALAGRRPGELSTGQCQRVAIARAVALRPRLLVADEPVTALDTPLRAGVLRLLRELVHEHGMAALVISHDMSTMEQLCDRVSVLDGGRIVEDLAVGDLRARAEHPLTRAFLAAQPLPPARPRVLPGEDPPLPTGGRTRA